MVRNIFFLFLLSGFLLHAEPPKWDLNEGWNDDELVLEYFHHSELQRQWAWELIGRYPLKGDERVLDFGCGDGKITAQLSNCLPDGEIIGVDISPQMISFASRTFPEKHYPHLRFLCTGNEVYASMDQFDRIYSFFVFHLVPEPQELLSELRSRLRENGEFIFLTPKGGNKPFFLAATRTFEEYGWTPPWKKRKASGSKPTMRTLEGIREIFEAAGWSITYINEIDTPHAFVTRDQLVHWMIGTVAANWDIPKSDAYPFFESLIDSMIEIDPTIVDEQGVHYFHLSRAHIVATP